MSQRTAIIIGAGPAGLTAAFEFVTRTGSVPILVEKSDAIGGISRTVRYNGNRIDIGGHRFFSRSDRVMNWWRKIELIQTLDAKIPPEVEVISDGLVYRDFITSACC